MKHLKKKMDPSCVKIYFSTGTYWKEWNQVEKERLDALQKRRGVVLPLDRPIVCDEEYANVNSDGIICLGNEHAKKTYSKFSTVINVNNAVFPDTYSTVDKNFEAARNNFLFFNGDRGYAGRCVLPDHLKNIMIIFILDTTIGNHRQRSSLLHLYGPLQILFHR